MNKPLLIAHRGDRINYPENTLEAFRSAFDKGADGVEMDIQLINGSIVIVHDYLIDHSKKYPLLKDVLRQFATRGRLELEIKAFTDEILSQLATLLDTYNPKDIELTTSEIPLVPYMVKKFPKTNIGAIFNECTYKEWMTEEVFLNKVIGAMKLLGASVAHIANLPGQMLTTSLVATIHKHSYKVHYHIGKVDMEEQLRLYSLLKTIGVDQFTFDDIGLIAELAK